MAEEIAFQGRPTQPYLAASYQVVHATAYYREMKEILQPNVAHERRFLYVDEAHRTLIVPVLKSLLFQGSIVHLSLFFEDGTRVDVYQVTNWDSFFVRPIKLGLARDQIPSTERTLLQQYDRILGASSDLWTPPSSTLEQIAANFLQTEQRQELISALTELDRWMPVGFKAIITSFKQRAVDMEDWTGLIHDLQEACHF